MGSALRLSREWSDHTVNLNRSPVMVHPGRIHFSRTSDEFRLTVRHPVALGVAKILVFDAQLFALTKGAIIIQDSDSAILENPILRVSIQNFSI